MYSIFSYTHEPAEIVHPNNSFAPDKNNIFLYFDFHFKLNTLFLIKFIRILLIWRVDEGYLVRTNILPFCS